MVTAPKTQEAQRGPGVGLHKARGERRCRGAWCMIQIFWFSAYDLAPDADLRLVLLTTTMPSGPKACKGCKSSASRKPGGTRRIKARQIRQFYRLLQSQVKIYSLGYIEQCTAEPSGPVRGAFSTAIHTGPHHPRRRCRQTRTSRTTLLQDVSSSLTTV